MQVARVNKETGRMELVDVRMIRRTAVPLLLLH